MRFISRASELRLIRKPSDRIMDEQRRPIILRGQRAEFANHRFSTNDPDLIEWLLNHPEYGLSFTSDQPDVKVVAVPPITTGPETTDDLYAKEIRQRQGAQVPPMVRGAMASVNSPAARADGATIENEASTPMGVVPMTEEQVGKIIDEKLEAGFNKLMSALLERKQESVSEALPKAKHVVHCKDCGQEFGSGFEVGIHKKTDCSGIKKE